MRNLRWMMGFALLAAAALCVGTSVAQDQSQKTAQPSSQDSVAEAARKAREQKKPPAKPARVYTDDDVKGAGTGAKPGDASGAPPPPQADAAQDQQGAKGKDASQTEAGWRKRFSDARARLAAAEKELNILQRELDQSQTQYYSDPQKAMNEQLTRKGINEKNAKLDAKQKEITQMKQQISDMEDELRRSGGDAGWSR